MGGRQEATLAPTDDQKPIVLFGGMKDGGKTTLLDAGAGEAGELQARRGFK